MREDPKIKLLVIAALLLLAFFVMYLGWSFQTVSSEVQTTSHEGVRS